MTRLLSTLMEFTAVSYFMFMSIVYTVYSYQKDLKDFIHRVPLVVQFWSKSRDGDYLEGTSVVSLSALLQVFKV